MNISIHCFYFSNKREGSSYLFKMRKVKLRDAMSLDFCSRVRMERFQDLLPS